MKKPTTQPTLTKFSNEMMSCTLCPPSKQKILHLALIGVFLVSGSATAGQELVNQSYLPNGSGQYIPSVLGSSTTTKSVAILDGAYAANSNIGRINVTVRNAGVPADGNSILDLEVEVFDKNDVLLKEAVLITLETTGGRLMLQGAASDEFGIGKNDADRLVPGTQIKVVGGKAYFGLVAPGHSQDVTLRLTGGNAEVTGVIPFSPDLRQMIAAGFVEGAIRLSKKNYASTISPVRLDDGFEQEISRFSRTNSTSSGNGLNETDKVIAGRAALFLKGKISGNNLLTLTVDSDKAAAARLLRDIKPDEYYAVYGDSSVRGFEARSSDRLYVRIDNQRSFVMYGDFSTADGFSQNTGGGIVAGTNLRQLATYNRSLTGVRTHLESTKGFINGFAAYDTLHNITEELRANGTSGPFAVNNTTALENSEKIELIVRDRTNLSSVLSVVALQRLIDYTFEPFSARILFNRAIPSLDPNGNPVSIRVSYEVDQGGSKFIVAGIDGQMNVGERGVIGAAYIQDKNPNAPVTIFGLNGGVKLDANTTLVAEIAQSKTSPDATALKATLALPASIPTVAAGERSGKAARITLSRETENFQGKAYYSRSEAGFSNQSNGASGVVNNLGSGNQQIGASLTLKSSSELSLTANVQVSKTLDTDASNKTASIGAAYTLNEAVTLKIALRHSDEQGILANSTSGIGCNPSAGSAYSSGSSGGFTGSNSSTLLNLNAANCTVATAAASGTTTVDRSSNTVSIGAEVKLTNKFKVGASVEGGKSQENGIASNQATRLELAASYQLFERTRLYARADSQRGLASQYSVDNASKSQSVAVGIDSSYMQGGNAFSEYRMRDSIGAEQAALATGLRNVFPLSEGLLLSTGVERLKLLSALGQNATAATLGVDYSQSSLWKMGGKLEWRRLDSSPATVAAAIAASTAGTPAPISMQDTTLFTLNGSRKMSQDWTLLARNYYLKTNNHGAIANGWQDRFQLGFAYRPEDNNKLDVLSKVEYKTENNINAQNEYRKVIVGALQANYHPSRPWWLSARLAAKNVNERFPANEGGSTDSYKAYLLSGRLGYDITENIDLGLNLSLMSGKAANQSGTSLQKGVGLEVGYLLASNLWASLGYNFAGYTDKDLTSDYSSKGLYMKLRYKFDQDLFQGANPTINNILEPVPTNDRK